MDNESLVLDLVEWVAEVPRCYADVMSAWRTSCPRLTIWEDAVDAHLVRRSGDMVEVTAAGLSFLDRHGRHAAPRGAACAWGDSEEASRR